MGIGGARIALSNKMFRRKNHYQGVWNQKKWGDVILKFVNFEKNDDEEYPLEPKKFNVTHRDIKPSNAMIDANSGVPLVDFGIGNGGIYLDLTEQCSAKRDTFTSEDPIRT